VDVEVPVSALRAGGANIRASAEGFGTVRFTVNVLGDSDRLDAVIPESIELALAANETADVRVSLDLPPDAVPNTVDIALAIDARPSFAAATLRLAQAFPEIVQRLTTAFPSIDFAFSVSKFQDYGGPGHVFRLVSPPGPEAELGRPFVLMQPSIRADSPENIQAIVDALLTTLPGGNELTTFSTYLEALNQIAHGAGIDANASGSALESGLAGVRGGNGELGYVAPGTSGDVPPFSSKPESIPSLGNLGGVGFRAGAQKIVLLATNTASVAPIDRTKPFPDQITGVGGFSVSSAYFQEVLTYPLPGTFRNPRFGAVSDSPSAPEPINAVAPPGSLTIPEVFDTLGAQGIQVVSFFQVSEAAPSGGFIDPRATLQAVARLTGALDHNRVPLVFELIGANTAAVADQIVEAIRPVVTLAREVTLRVVGNDEGFGFSFTPESRPIAPGQTATFDTTISGTGTMGDFEIQFVADTTILGRIPVTIRGGDVPRVTAVTPPSGPIGTQVTITGVGFGSNSADVQVRFGSVAAQVLTVDGTTIQTAVPAGSVAGPVDIVVTAAGQDSNPFPFTVLHTINSFSPTSGTGGIEFTIQGNAFAPGVTANTVTFGGTAATILEATNTLIRGTVPSNLVANNYPVRITTNGVTADVGTFNLLPGITGIVPPSGGGDTPITINGSGFSSTPGENTVTFTDPSNGATATAAVASSTFTSIQARVPNQLVGGQYNVTVAVNGRTSAPVTFTVTPFITSVTPESVRIGDQLFITGLGFSPNLAENVVTLNGRTVPLDAGSTVSTLVVTAAPGISGTSLAVVVTVRGAPSNTVSVELNPAPVILTQVIGGRTYQGVSGRFERRDLIVVDVSGADPNGDVVLASFVIRDGEGQVLGTFNNVDVRSQLANQSQFVFRVPFENANHFTAAISVLVRLEDAAGNTSNSVTGVIVNPDIRQ
jgi:hypothetical protein